MDADPIPGIRLVATVLDTTDARRAAEFYRALLGWTYRPGHEPPPPGEPDPEGQDWLILQQPGGSARLSFQQVAELAPSTWPDGAVPQQLHLDVAVTSRADLDAAAALVERLGGRTVRDRSEDPAEPLRVHTDLDGHPFCVFVDARSAAP